MLLRLPWAEAWFDIEEGVKLYLVVDDIQRALLLLDNLRTAEVRLSDEGGESLVNIRSSRLDPEVLTRVRARLEAAGLRSNKYEFAWELSPDRR
ncbi:MAG TPA: hypothetical protein VMU81_09750 [Acetobacteraceae bacterium]|nr:hypothetical protein [Acetobacteraceae bacterium]